MLTIQTVKRVLTWTEMYNGTECITK